MASIAANSRSAPPGRRAIVTGGAGFIGSHVVEALVAEGWRVAVVDDLSSGRAHNVPPEAELLQADVRAGEAYDFVLRFRPGALAHLAAQVSVARSVSDPALDASVNVLGTLRMVQAAAEAGADRVVLASSAAVYGRPRRLPIDEEHPLDPVSPYGASKLAAEVYARVLMAGSAADWVVLRYANVYGPRQDARGEAGVVAAFADRLRAGLPLIIHGDGEQSRDFVYVEDVAEATLRAMSAEGARGKTLNVGTGTACTVRELARRIWEAAAGTGPVPVQLAPPRPGDIRDSMLARRRAAEALGWWPRHDLDEGLRRTIAYWGAGAP